MTAYIFLGTAILLEISFFVLMKQYATEHNYWKVMSISPLILASLFFEAKAIGAGLDASLAYMMWAGIGIVALAIIGHSFWGEKINLIGLSAILMIISGITVLFSWGYR